MTRTPPWPIDGPELLTQIRWIVWALEGGDRVGTTLTHAPTDRGRETIAGLTWRCYSEDYLRLATGQRCPLEQFQALTLDDVVTVLMEVFALRTNRPYRDAWPFEKVAGYLIERSGTEFDPDLANAFVRMMRNGEAQVTVLTDEDAALTS